MFRVSLAVLVAAQAVASAPRAATSPAQADAFAHKLEAFAEAARAKGKAEPVIVTEGELNSYVNYTLGPTLPAGLRDVEVQLEADRLNAAASVDIDEVKKELGELSPWNPVAFLSGRVPVSLAGRYLAAEDGFARVEIQEARAAGVRLPIPLLEQMVAGATRTSSDPDGFDIHAPFRLPHPVRRVRLMPGRASLHP